MSLIQRHRHSCELIGLKTLSKFGSVFFIVYTWVYIYLKQKITIMKRFILLVFMPFIGIVFCHAAPASVTRSTVELTIHAPLNFEYVIANHVSIESDFRYEQSYWACLYLNQCKQIRSGYNSTYGIYSNTPIDDSIRVCNRSSI